MSAALLHNLFSVVYFVPFMFRYNNTSLSCGTINVHKSSHFLFLFIVIVTMSSFKFFVNELQ